MPEGRTDGVADVSGAQFGKYRIVRKLGDGTYGAVYEAFLPGAMGFAKRVAIKRLRPYLVAGDKRFLQSMINEARIGALLSHVNIVSIIEFDQVEGHYYLAMEYVDGATIEEIIRFCQRQRVLLPRFAVIDLVVQVCRGLQHTHQLLDHDGRQLRLVHRDIKPSNIIIDRDGTARILDFGIAKAATNLFNNTEPGLTKGTPRYMSPEQLRGEFPLSPRSDLFSLGVVLYELITARPLFFGDSLMALLHQVVSGDIHPRLLEAESAFPGCGPILERALSRDAGGRYSDARTMAADLRKLGQRYPSEAETADAIRALMPILERPTGRRIQDASELDRDDAMPEADDFVADEDMLGTAPIRPPPAGSSGWREYTDALTALLAGPPTPVTDSGSYELATTDLETMPPEGRLAVTQLAPPSQPEMEPPHPRRTPWIAVAAAVVVLLGFALGVAAVATWLAGRAVIGGAAVPEDGITVVDEKPVDVAVVEPAADPAPDSLDIVAEVTPALVEPVLPVHDVPPPRAEERDEPTPAPLPEVRTVREPTEERRKHTSAGTVSLHVVQFSRISVDGVVVHDESNALWKHPVEGGHHEVRVVCGSPLCPCPGLEKTYSVHVDGDAVKIDELDFGELAHSCPSMD